MQTAEQILTIESITENIYQRMDREEKKIIDTMNQMRLLQLKTNQKVGELKAKIPSLIKALEKQGLAISQLGYSKAGKDDKVWNEGDQLSVSITAVPTSGKFRFIKDTGFTAKGRGRNQNRLDAKAESLANAIKKETGFSGVNVNSFSLEIENEGDSKSILIGAWL